MGPSSLSTFNLPPVGLSLSVITASGGTEAELGEMGERPREDAGGGVGVVARVQLDIGIAGVLVSDTLEIVEADVACATPSMAGDAMPGPLEAASRLASMCSSAPAATIRGGADTRGLRARPCRRRTFQIVERSCAQPPPADRPHSPTAGAPEGSAPPLPSSAAAASGVAYSTGQAAN
jgi:hypothetical protein